MSECKPCHAQRVRDRVRAKNVAVNLREKVFEVLGAECVQCGYDDKRALQFDHINNNGAKERKKYKGYAVYRRIVKVKGKSYQVLCCNCNWIKRVEDIKKNRAK